MTTHMSRTTSAGTAGGTAINADVSGGPSAAGDAPWVLKYVTLSASYTRSGTQSFPTIAVDTGAASSLLDTKAQTVNNGTRIQLFACEAAALVAAGKATYS